MQGNGVAVIILVGSVCFPQADKTRDDKSGYCVESSIHRADNEPSDKTTYQGRMLQTYRRN